MPVHSGSEEHPWRVAVVGSGPSAFYATEALFKSDKPICVDCFERLPAPFGLVRYGVAPDHAKIKNVIRVYEKTAVNERFRFFGNVMIGRDLSMDELRNYYDAILFANGAQTDRNLGIEGETLSGSHAATEFVAWYNGHPEFQDREFDLSCEAAVVIGQGNVAMDVARILCKTVDELKETDITAHALDVLAESRIRQVHLIGRRGPAQAKFTPPELKEFMNLEDCDPVVREEDLRLNEASREELEDPDNKKNKKNFELMREMVGIPRHKNRSWVLHFCKSPSRILGSGRVEKIVLEHNELSGEVNAQKARGIGVTEELECGLIFRSIGYKGVPIPDVPFDEKRAVIQNTTGRVMNEKEVVPGVYVAGWIKRGPSGVIGTNKPDAEETVKLLLEDLPSLPGRTVPEGDVADLLKERGIRFVSYADWKKIDAEEIARGTPLKKPREKFVSAEEMLKVLD